MRNIALATIYVFSLWTAAAWASGPVKVMVFPLNGSSKNEALAWLGEGIAISLSNQLSGRGVEVINRVGRIELVENLDLPPGGQLSRGSMIRVAQRGSVDLVVMGTYTGTEKNLKISVRVLDVQALKLSGEMSANGPLSALPQMENELAWLILTNTDLDRTSSREKFQERMRKIPNSAYAYYIMSLEATGESEQIHLLLKAVETYRDFPDAQYQLGHLYFHRGDCVSAIPHLMLGKGEAKAQPENDFMLGTCYLQGDQSIQAIQAFSRMLQVSRPYEALNNLGVAYLRNGDNTPALNALLEAKNLARSDSTVSLNLAIVRHLQGNDSAAHGALEDAIKAHPKNGMLQFLLGVLLNMQGESDKASLATGKAKSLGINVEKLQSEDPKMWSRILLTWEGSKTFSGDSGTAAGTP